MDDNNTWKVLDLYVRDCPNFLVKHHLESYNDFVNVKIPKIIQSLNPFVVLKNDASGKLKHEIRVFVGMNGKDDKDIQLVGNESLYPNEARLKSLTYKADLICNVLIEIDKHDSAGGVSTHTSVLKDVKIGAVPIMLGSELCLTRGMQRFAKRNVGECVYDDGGYFVIDGKEKVIVAQERTVTNKMYVQRSKKPNYDFQALIRCTQDEGAIFPKVVRFWSNLKDGITVEIPKVKGKLPLFVLFRALGIASDKEILEYIFNDTQSATKKQLDFIYPSIREGGILYLQQQAMNYIQKRTDFPDNPDHVKYILLYDLFPNVAVPETGVLHKKIIYLGTLIREFVDVATGLKRETDRDNYAYKRVDISGHLLSNKFRDLYNKFRVECRSAIDREYNYGPAKKEGIVDNLINPNNIWKIFQSNIIEDGIRKALKGQWGGDDGGGDGIVQDLSRVSYIGFVSHMRRVNSPIDRSIKIVDPHRLHATQWGMMCPCESPDGASIGLLKNMAAMCHITSDSPGSALVKCLQDLGAQSLDGMLPTDLSGMSVKVVLNNNLIGITDRPHEIVSKLKLLRRNALINVMTSISWDIVGRVISLKTDAGRCCRPLYIVDASSNVLRISNLSRRLENLTWLELITGSAPVKNRGMDLTTLHSFNKYIDPKTVFPNSTDVWEQLKVHQSAIEFIDVEETNTCMIATRIDELSTASSGMKYTHCEIHPSTIFAVLTANIPFANHNQAPRNYFSGAQGKQAIGVYSTQFNNRMDVMGLVLHYPQKALVNTRYMHYMHNMEMPNGENAIVAIMCYSGYNQEDSLIINRGAVQRGLFNLTYFKTIEDSESFDKYSGERIIFDNPIELARQGTKVDGLGKRFANYTKLDKNGMPIVNTKIYPEDVYLGKVLITKDLQDEAADASDNVFKSKIAVENYQDKSEIANKTMSFIVDKVVTFEDSVGSKRCKIRTRKIRQPVLGDKHASRHAQKGTIGMILNPEDMPFTKDGIVPDLIINPHAIPTRMTIAHLIDCVMGKLACLKGVEFDATPFCDQDIDRTYDELQSFGFERYGNEIMHNGITGEQIPTEIFIGPTYMLRLKHMVDDKINVRSKDDGYAALTHQPVKSRAKGGGLRIGEMEVFSVMGHGMASFLKESMVDRSDHYAFTIDKSSGDIGIANLSKGFAKSKMDPTNSDFAFLHAPYSMKLWLQELQTACLMPRLEFERDDVVPNSESEGESDFDVDVDVDGDEEASD
jgi:DNA-directed RNA polymerase II subunit RPB2